MAADVHKKAHMSTEGEGNNVNRGEKDRLLRKIIMALSGYREIRDITGSEDFDQESMEPDVRLEINVYPTVRQVLRKVKCEAHASQIK